MKTMHLFAGAGGGLLADLILGHQPICAVEYDKFCCEVLRKRASDGWFPELHVWEGDIRLFNPSDWNGRVDCIHAGFPCQDISVAGAGAGIDGERSGLWSEVVRVAGEIQPRYIFLENSPAITVRGLGRVLGDLAAMGYDARWCVLPASAIGAPHLRARWWCLASRAASDTDSDNGEAGDWEYGGQLKPWASATGSGCNHVANPGRGLLENGWQSRTAKEATERPRCGHRPAWWTAEPGVGRMADGVANRVDRIRALGNGQVPLQAAAAWMMLAGGE